MPTPTPCPELHAERIVLRPVREEDRYDLWAMWEDAGSAALGGFDVPQGLDDVAGSIAYFQRLNRAGFYYKWVIASRADGAFLGDFELYPTRPQIRPWVEWSCGYCLKPGARGQGYMHEAMVRVLRFAFEESTVWRIKADVLSSNTRSADLLVRHGFWYEGVQRDKNFATGAFADLRLYALTRAAYAAAKEGAGQVTMAPELLSPDP